MIIFYYEEILRSGSFTAELLPFTQHSLAKDFRSQSQRAFKDNGGLRIVDNYSAPNIHLRTSYWKSENGYKDWASNSELAQYFKLRSDYNSKNYIEERLRGPFMVADSE